MQVRNYDLAKITAYLTNDLRGDLQIADTNLAQTLKARKQISWPTTANILPVSARDQIAAENPRR